MVDNLAWWLWGAAFTGYCAFFGVSLHRLRLSVAGTHDQESSQRTRKWATQTGLLLPATFLPVYVKEVTAAVRDLGPTAVVAPALAVGIGMIGAGAWTAACFFRLERRAQQAAHPPA